MMKLPVCNTFVHFRTHHGSRRRCCSSPAEVFIDEAIKETMAKEALLRARAKKWAARITRKWRKLVAAAWSAKEAQNLHEAREQAGGRVDSLTPKLRVTLNSDLFVQFAGKVFEDPKDILILCAMGVIREKDQAVEFWCADDSFRHETMQAMLQEAERMRQGYEDNALQLWMIGRTPLVFPWSAKITLDYTRRLVEKHLHVPKARQKLSHLGDTLRPGLLSDQGIGRGACIHVARQ